MLLTQATENYCSVAQIQQLNAKRQRVWVQPLPGPEPELCIWCKNVEPSRIEEKHTHTHQRHIITKEKNK